MNVVIAYPKRQNGIFLPIGCANTRITAESGDPIAPTMDSRRVQRNMGRVVYALPLGALFASLFRYPSPKGRHCATPRRPSFFYGISSVWRDQRAIAQNRHYIREGFDARGALASCAAQDEHNKRGIFPCDLSFSRPQSLSSLPPAAKRRWSRGSLEQVWALALRRCWTATWRLVLPSGRQATCFTARPTRTAVDLTATKSHRGRNCFCSHWLSRSNAVDQAQWGASTKRGAEYGHHSKSSNLVSNSGGMQRPRRVEPHGIRPVYADSDCRLIAFPGSAARSDAPTTLTKRRTWPWPGAALLSFSDD